MRKFIAATLITLCAAAAQANIVYEVHRVFGGGAATVDGLIETNGATGLPGDPISFVDWDLTFAAGPLVEVSQPATGAGLSHNIPPAVLSSVGLLVFNPGLLFNQHLMFSNSTPIDAAWCFGDTAALTFCGALPPHPVFGAHLDEALDIGGTVYTLSHRAGAIFATQIPVPGPLLLLISALATVPVMKRYKGVSGAR